MGLAFLYKCLPDTPLPGSDFGALSLHIRFDVQGGQHSDYSACVIVFAVVVINFHVAQAKPHTTYSRENFSSFDPADFDFEFWLQYS